MLLSTVGLSDGQLALVILAVLFLAAVCMAILAEHELRLVGAVDLVAVGLLNGFITYYRTKTT